MPSTPADRTATRSPRAPNLAREGAAVGLGAVVIGRNEGERLRRCLESLVERAARVVYVDSGSTDGSVAMARGLGVEVIDLDTSVPFTAARARNAGFFHLVARHSEVQLVQFVDGDCELLPGWLEAASAALEGEQDLALVCGRLRERYPEQSVYNLLCDMEWDGPVGEVDSTGGVAMARASALLEVNGYRTDLIAGEEPEMGVRLRLRGWRMRRLAHDMALHDAAITRFAQWWRRSVRAGYAYGEGRWLHGDGPTRHFVRQTRRIWLWGLALPAVALAGALPTGGLSLLLLGAYPLSLVRAARAQRARGRSVREALAYGAFCTLGKLPELQGLARFHAGRLLGRRSALIEYKRPGPSTAPIQSAGARPRPQREVARA